MTSILRKVLPWIGFAVIGIPCGIFFGGTIYRQAAVNIGELVSWGAVVAAATLAGLAATIVFGALAAVVLALPGIFGKPKEDRGDE